MFIEKSEESLNTFLKDFENLAKTHKVGWSSLHLCSEELSEAFQTINELYIENNNLREKLVKEVGIKKSYVCEGIKRAMIV